MSFLTPLGLLAFVALPLVVGLHLFRRRYKERKVAGLFLWSPDLLRSQSGRKRTRLLRSPSLWIELCAAMTAALALGGLHLGASDDASPLVLVLDDSASMSALDGDRTARDRTVEQIRDLLESLGPSVRCTVILSGTHPRVLIGPDAGRASVLEALSTWQPHQPTHRLGPALGMGRQMTSTGARLHLFTDADPGQVDLDYEVHALGQDLDNTALLGARRIRSTDGQKLLIDLLSFGREPIETRIHIRLLDVSGVAGRFESTTSLVPDRIQHLSIEVPFHAGSIEIELAKDALALDNRILLLPDSLRVVRFENALPAPLTQALGIDGLAMAIPGLEPAGAGDVPALRFATEPGPIAPWRTELVVQVPESTSALLGPFLLERRHPLLHGVLLEGVIWSASQTGPPPGFPLVLAGDLPLLTEENQTRFHRYRLGIDPSRSNLAKAPDWPIFLSNLVDLVRKRLPGQVDRNLPSSEELVYRHAGPLEQIPEMRLVTPAGQRRQPAGLREIRFAPEGPGLYRLERGDEELARWSLHFVDPTESDLRTRGSMHRDAVASPGTSEEHENRPGEWERKLLSLLLLLLVLADWWVLEREGNA